jgi:hypothetical protein
MLILGIDPGLAHGGYALLDSRDARIRRAGYLGTAKGTETGDTQRRLAEQLDQLVEVVALADLVVVEWPSAGGFGVRGSTCPACLQAPGNARATALTSASAGAVVGLARGRARGPVLTPAPPTWRAPLGFRPGQDDQLYAWLERIYPQTSARFPRGKRAHVFDAVGLALYGRLRSTNQTQTRRTA